PWTGLRLRMEVNPKPRIANSIMSYHRTGTIAQLPRDVRDEVNRMLDNGCRYKAVVSWLEANGHPGVKASHIGEWKKGGYQEWLEEHRELAREQKVLEF